MIDLLPDPEQQSVADSVAGFLQARLPVERHSLSGRHAGEHELDLWRELAEIGCFSLSVSEEHGGVGLTLAEEVLAFREYGRHLVSPSMLATVLAANLAHAVGDHARGGHLASGSARAALALALPGGTFASRGCSGEMQVVDARPGDLVLAWNDDGMALFEQEALGPMSEVACTDESLAMRSARPVNAKPLLWLPAAVQPLTVTGQVMVSALLVGMAEAVRDMAVAHAKARMQFGQLIGTFQAIKHCCADMALRAEAAWSQTVYAALSLRAGTLDSAFQAATAKLIATRAALDGAADNIQVHGGMGFTAEIEAHLFLKRAHVYNQLGGNVRHLQGRLLELPRDA